MSNSDYAAVKALVDGEVSFFMGFEFIKTELLSLASTDYRTCFAYAKTGLLRSMGQAPSGSIDKRADKNNAYQVYFNGSFGASRMQEKFVVQVLCDESP